MTIQDAIDYINLALKEGYMSEDEAERLMNLPYKQTIKEVEELAERGDAQI